MINNTNNEIFKRMIIENKMQNKNNNTIITTTNNSEETVNESEFSLILNEDGGAYVQFNKGYGINKRLRSVKAYYGDMVVKIILPLYIESIKLADTSIIKKPVIIYTGTKYINLNNVYYDVIKCCLVDNDNNIINLNTTVDLDAADDIAEKIKNEGTNFSTSGYELYIIIECITS